MSDWDLSSLPPSTNAYLAILESAGTEAYTLPASPSFRTRLIVLFCLTVFGIFGATTHLALLLVDGRRRGQSVLWLFRLKPGYSGRFIVTNGRLVTTLLSIAILLCQIGAIENMWTAALLHGSQRSTRAWRSLLVFPVVAQLWLASWGALTGYLVRVDLFSRAGGANAGGEEPKRRGLSARLANIFFILGFAIFSIAPMSTSVIVIVCGTRTWSAYLIIRRELLALAPTWSGAPDYTALAPVFKAYPEMCRLARIYLTAYLVMYSTCTIAMASMVILNVGSFLIARHAQREARARLEALSAETREGYPDTPMTGYFVPLTPDSHTTTFDGKDLCPPTPASIPRALAHRSRRSLERLAGNAAVGIEGQQASQLLRLEKVETDLRITAAWLGAFALVGMTISLYYGVYVCGEHMWAKGTWATQEAAITALPWLYIFTTSIIVYPRLVYTAWRSTAPCPSLEGGKHSWCLCGLSQAINYCCTCRRRNAPATAPSGRVRVRVEEKVTEEYLESESISEGMEVTIEGGVATDAGDLEESQVEEPRLGGGIGQVTDWTRPNWAWQEPESQTIARVREGGEAAEGGASAQRTPLMSWAGSGIPLEWSMVPPPSLAPPPPARRKMSLVEWSMGVGAAPPPPGAAKRKMSLF